ncbi:Ni/Fe-hydrogenase B-type cytochrome subunit [Corynebacterium aquilae DSM 44791]|uniref:Ni/Fe-hydrogenase B-type cytochrome subunit n=1 Tax=Corynebacterium aquilae DSM 44791 TaxID=1431546 RepID=A0A1L7CE17_9CORY|nr:Ni/Fe-hydrogenase B-type cytochrome subunit [Corynebacterium aquilae DSM 44791]
MWVARTYSSRKLTSGRLLCMAAVAPKDSEDPIDRALLTSLHANRPDIEPVFSAHDQFSPATPQRRYSLTRANGFLMDKKHAPPADIMIMRGEVEAVLGAAKLSSAEKAPFLRHVDLMERMGQRCLALASAPIAEDGTVGDFQVEGFVSLALEPRAKLAKSVAENPNAWVRVNLWSATLRFQHWANMALIVAMTVTGAFIMDPGLLPPPGPGDDTGFIFGIIRFIHFLAGFGWIVLGLSRVWLAFVAKDRQLRWRAFWPLNSKKDVSGLIETIKYYAFINKHGPVYLAHNPLQQLSYTGIYVLCLFQMATGLGLFGLYNQYNGLWALLTVPVSWLGIPTVRLIHTLIMFVIWAFVVIHVYLAVRADSVERHGGISSMINGGVWLRRGTNPIDAPKIG